MSEEWTANTSCKLSKNRFLEIVGLITHMYSLYAIYSEDNKIGYWFFNNKLGSKVNLR